PRARGGHGALRRRPLGHGGRVRGSLAPPPLAHRRRRDPRGRGRCRPEGRRLSGAAASRRGVGAQLTHLLLLGGFGALIFYVTRLVPEMHGSLWTIAAIGFLLLAGTLLSELLSPLGLPHLTGYLIAGIASGPYALKLVDEHTVKTLSPVNMLA